MNAESILERARASGVILVADGQQIRYRGPATAVQDLLPRIKAHKPELFALLRHANEMPGSSSTDSEKSDHWRVIDCNGQREMWFSPEVSRMELRERFPEAVLIPFLRSHDNPRAPSCSSCAHLSIYGNCGEPTRAGLTASFELIAPPVGHAVKCGAFQCKTLPV